MYDNKLFKDLKNYLTNHNDVPGKFMIKAKTLADPVQLIFLQNSSSISSLMNGTFTETFKKSFIASIIQDYTKLQETSVRNLINYLNHAKGSLRNMDDAVNCEVLASVDVKNMKFHEVLDITITVPCFSKPSSDPFEIFKSPIKVLVPIAEYIDELEIQSTKNCISRVIAKVRNISREDFDYLFEHPTYYVHQETRKQWMKQFLKVYHLVKSTKGEILSLPVVDGSLGKHIPLESRAEHQHFAGYSETKKTEVYHVSK